MPTARPALLPGDYWQVATCHHAPVVPQPHDTAAYQRYKSGGLAGGDRATLRQASRHANWAQRSTCTACAPCPIPAWSRWIAAPASSTSPSALCRRAEPTRAIIGLIQKEQSTSSWRCSNCAPGAELRDSCVRPNGARRAAASLGLLSRLRRKRSVSETKWADGAYPANAISYNKNNSK